MKTLSLYSAALSALLFAATAWSDDAQSEMTFSQGSVLVICALPEGKEVSSEDFKLAFPQWISTLQKRANEGIVKRAHYLGELKSGVFIVVGGDTKDSAMTNAVAVSDELNTIFKEVTGNDIEGSCRFREIGPVAILPK